MLKKLNLNFPVSNSIVVRAKQWWGTDLHILTPSVIYNWTNPGNRKKGICLLAMETPACKQSLLCLLPGRGREGKGGFAGIASSVWSRHSPTFGLADLVFSRQTGLFECEHPFIDKSMVITDPTIPSARLLVLGSKMYLSNIHGMLNKDYTWPM